MVRRLYFAKTKEYYLSLGEIGKIVRNILFGTNIGKILIGHAIV